MMIGSPLLARQNELVPTMAETATPPQTGNRFARWVMSFDDGRLMRAIFFGLLFGTIGVLVVDYLELQDANAAIPDYQPMATPILPSVERPEIDPDNPAFAPQTRITTAPELLGDPMVVRLEANGVLKLEGVIQPGSADALKTELEARGEYIKTVELNSPGGIVQEALAMGALIRDGGFTTQVGDGALCASSCPLIFASGKARIAHQNAAIGVHQIYGAGAPGGPNPAQAMSDAQSTTATITRYLTEMQTDPALWLHALETPPDKLYYFTSDELEELKLATKIVQ